MHNPLRSPFFSNPSLRPFIASKYNFSQTIKQFFCNRKQGRLEEFLWFKGLKILPRFLGCSWWWQSGQWHGHRRSSIDAGAQNESWRSTAASPTPVCSGAARARCSKGCREKRLINYFDIQRENFRMHCIFSHKIISYN